MEGRTMNASVREYGDFAVARVGELVLTIKAQPGGRYELLVEGGTEPPRPLAVEITTPNPGEVMSVTI